MFDSILVANRGEIALRIMRTAQAMGIQTIAIYVEADKDAPHVRFADKAVLLPDGGYLDIDAVLDAAQKSNAGAIHPGYGFLSENSEFAKRVIKEKIIWVGPSPKVISVMGDKLKAKELAIKASVPTLPMTSNEKEVKKIGYPLLIKAAAGGGGKGMRAVWDKKDFKKSWTSAKQEASAAFGNDDMYIEKLIQEPRHIEIQIIADQFGNVCHLSERDCSIQRRHQKLTEETPSPFMTSRLRDKMGKAAVKAAKFINYEGVGTVEFLVDSDRNFYFMEMNTRIQVEHPITEQVIDYDLIREQIKVAAGEPIKGKNYFPKLCSIECRINAEDSVNDFMPNPGKILNLHFPGGHGVRIDTHVYSGYVIPPHYDSMIAKLITTAQTRDEAINKMKRALDEFVIEGVKTTIPFHKKMMEHPDFISGNYTIRFMDSADV